jgi:hypothetical protein
LASIVCNTKKGKVSFLRREKIMTAMEDKFETIIAHCLQETSADPVANALRLMADPAISMHGPEHHLLDGAALLTAYHNAGGRFDLRKALLELKERASLMPGATCGYWGVCGSAASVGAALAILHGTGPLSDNDYYKDNLALTSRCLAKIGDLGGPRCCKRNAFLSLTTAASFLEERYGVKLPIAPFTCPYSNKNPTCLHEKCLFNQNHQKK